MKNRIFSVLLCFLSFTSIAQAAETVDCIDASGSWKVNFQLEGKVVSQLQFNFADQLVASYPPIRALVSQSFRKIYYNINFNQLSYFDFSRKKGSNELSGAFFILESPTGLETPVTCNAH